MTTYLVTAIMEDNRESTMKVCSRVEDPYNAVDSIVFTLMNRIDPPVSEDVVKESWMILYMSCIQETEGREHNLPLYEAETQK